MGRLLAKDEVQFGPVADWAGARILEVLKIVAVRYPFDVVITSARDGAHSGPDDPHHQGAAFDFRTHDLTAPQISRLVYDLTLALGPRFYVFWEAPGTPNDHIHCQRSKGTTYTAADYLKNA